jgi:hypothetical protein
LETRWTATSSQQLLTHAPCFWWLQKQSLRAINKKKTNDEEKKSKLYSVGTLKALSTLNSNIGKEYFSFFLLCCANFTQTEISQKDYSGWILNLG